MLSSVSAVRLYTESLTALSDGELQALFEARPDLAAAEPADFEELARLAVAPASVKARYERLDEGSQQLLEAAAALGEAPAIAKLAAGLGLEPEALEPHLRRLTRDGLACLLAGSRLLLNPGLVRILHLPAGLGPPLRDLLGAATSQKLGELCEQLGLRRRRERAAALEDLSEALSSPERVAAVVSAGPAGSAELAAHLAVSGEIRVDYGAGGTYQLARSANSPVGHLLRHGVLVATSGISAVAPAEVGAALRGGRLLASLRLEPPPLDHERLAAAASDTAPAEKARLLVDDVARMTAQWGLEPPRLLQAGGLGVREVRRAAKLLGRPERETAQLVELALAASLVAIDPRDALVLPTAGFDAWSALPSPARWVHLASAWLASGLSLSVAGASGSDGKVIPPLSGFFHPRAPERRKVVLELLAGLPEGCCASSPSLLERAAWQAPSCWAGGPARPETLARWVLEEAELLGLVEKGRLSAFARPLLAGDLLAAAKALAELSPPLVGALVIQGDLTAVAAGELEPALRCELELIADLESAGAATVYRFSEASLRRGLDAGKSAAEILSFLAERAVKGVPQALGYLVEDLGRRYGKLRLGAAASFVRCEEAALIGELCRAKRLRRAELRAVAPTVAISRLPPPALLSLLRDAGYLAAVEDNDGSLAVVRPPARRAAGVAGDFLSAAGALSLEVPGLGSFDADELEVLLDELGEEDVSEIFDDLGISPATIRPLLATRAAKIDVPAGRPDAAELVARLRRPRPPRPAKRASAASRGGSQRPGDGPAQLALLEEMLESLLDGTLEQAR